MSLQFWFQVTEDWRILPQSGLLTRSSSRGCGSLCTPFFSWERRHPPLPRGQQRWWCFVPLSLLASADRVSSLLKCSLSPSLQFYHVVYTTLFLANRCPGQVARVGMATAAADLSPSLCSFPESLCCLHFSSLLCSSVLSVSLLSSHVLELSALSQQEGIPQPAVHVR